MIIDARAEPGKWGYGLCAENHDEYVQYGIRTAQAILKTFGVPRKSWENTNISVYYDGMHIAAIFRGNRWLISEPTSYTKTLGHPLQIVLELSTYAENAMNLEG